MVVGWSLAMVGCPPQWCKGRSHATTIYTAGWSLATYIYTVIYCMLFHALEHADNVAAASQVQRGTQNTVARYV